MSHFNEILKKRSTLDGSEFIITAGLIALTFAAFISSCNTTVDQRSMNRERYDRKRAAASSTMYARGNEGQRSLLPAFDEENFTSTTVMREPWKRQGRILLP